MQVKLVFLDSFPAYWDEERLKEDLKKYNENEKFQLLKKITYTNWKDCVFVHFSTREEAYASVNSLKSSEIGEGESNTCMEAFEVLREEISIFILLWKYPLSMSYYYMVMWFPYFQNIGKRYTSSEY